MKIDLRSELRALHPVTLQEKLRSRGWELTRKTERVGVYRRGADELDVPLDTRFADYPRRVEELLEILADLEGMRPTDLLETLVEPEGDALALRVASPLTESGTIPLEDAIRIRHGAKTMILAAAHSTISPQPWFARLTQRDPMSLLSNVREGQSQRGSFTMRCIVPVAPLVGESSEEPYGRRVIRTLVKALGAVEHVRSIGDRRGLLQHHEQGVSGNLLAGLAAMRPPGGSGEFEVSVVWSRSRPSPSEDLRPIRLQSNAFDGLMEAALALRDQFKAKGCEVKGYVTRLDQDVGSQNRGGQVVIAPTEGDAHELGNVLVHLHQQDYLEAIEAHKQGNSVRVLGTLEKKGRRWTLTAPTGFERCSNHSSDGEEE